MIRDSCIRAVFESSLKLTSGESCLIVTDTVKEAIARQFFAYAASITPYTKIAVMEPRTENGEEPTKEVAQLMLQYDVLLLITKVSLSHTRSRRDASKRGSRIASMPSITEDIANRCLDIDYAKQQGECRRLRSILAASRSMKIVTGLGTDFYADIGGGLGGQGKICGEDGGVFDYPGAFGNLPEGEVSFLPLNARGAFVVDASFPGLGLLSSPLICTVSDGRVVDIRGSSSVTVKKRLDRIGEKAYSIAEIGIGVNERAVIAGTVLEDEKVRGTVHIALGNDLSYGGTNDCAVHLDGVITGSTIEADGKGILRGGVPCW